MIVHDYDAINMMMMMMMMMCKSLRDVLQENDERQHCQ